MSFSCDGGEIQELLNSLQNQRNEKSEIENCLNDLVNSLDSISQEIELKKDDLICCDNEIISINSKLDDFGFSDGLF